jgi:hypothetical protein
MYTLQFDFNILNDYFIQNELYISAEKTAHIEITVPKMTKQNICGIYKHFGNCKNLNTTNNIHKCNNECMKLEKKISTKYLGIEIDQHWKFKTQTRNIIKNLRQLIPKIYQIKHCLNIAQKKIIYNAWIKSVISYGIEIYGYTSAYLIERIQKTQNKLIKVLFSNINNTVDTLTLYKMHNILKIRELRDYITVIGNYYDNKYKIVSRNVQRMRITKGMYEVPRFKNSYGKRRKLWIVPTLYNMIDPYKLNNCTFTEFKKHYKTLLIDRMK